MSKRKPFFLVCLYALILCLSARGVAAAETGASFLRWLDSGWDNTYIWENGNAAKPGGLPSGIQLFIDWLRGGWDNEGALTNDRLRDWLPGQDVPTATATPQPTPSPTPKLSPTPAPTPVPAPTHTRPPRPTQTPFGYPYDLKSGALLFELIDFDETPFFDDLSALSDYLYACRENNVRQIAYRLPEGMDKEAMFGLLHSYMWVDCSYEYQKSPAGQTTSYLVKVSDTPGLRIAEAFLAGGTDGLTADELFVYRKAATLLARLRSEATTQLQLERAIHDALCDAVTYWTDDGKHEGEYEDYTTAIGVFRNGRANCSGYADAFLMLARMAGFKTYTLSGTATSADGTEAHRWNVIQVGGRWYFVDVTWDDAGATLGRVDPYQYFNIGQSLMRSTHSWRDDHLHYPVVDDIDSHYLYNFAGVSDHYRAADPEALKSALRDGLQKGRLPFYLMCEAWDDQAAVAALVDEAYADWARSRDRSVALPEIVYTHAVMGDALFMSVLPADEAK